MENLVSAIMPTSHNRSDLAKLAIKCFEHQIWPNKELIIVEDNLTIGEKLNIACTRAKGNILIRWDDDDWSSPTRISEQVTRLLQARKSLTGFHQIYFWDIYKRIASNYRGTKNYCLGTSMCFTREYWNKTKFPVSSYGEDLLFQKLAKDTNEVISFEANQTMVARLHKTNTGSSKLVFPQVPKEKLPQQFFIDLGG